MGRRDIYKIRTLKVYKEYNNSDIPIRDICEKHNLNIATYYSYLRLLRQAGKIQTGGGIDIDIDNYNNVTNKEIKIENKSNVEYINKINEKWFNKSI